MEWQAKWCFNKKAKRKFVNLIMNTELLAFRNELNRRIHLLLSRAIKVMILLWRGPTSPRALKKLIKRRKWDN